jgi:hypothetical protein
MMRSPEPKATMLIPAYIPTTKANGQRDSHEILLTKRVNIRSESSNAPNLVQLPCCNSITRFGSIVSL